MTPIQRALISVSDKTGLLEFARALREFDIEILSTGGTAKLLAQHGIAVKEVSEHTGFPEMMDGRVKTLHPKIHGGILARRDLPEHVEAMRQHGIPPIDLVVVNLYPFEQTVAKPDCTFGEAIENIDIGGPAMVRSSAKNHDAVAVVVDIADYDAVLAEMKQNRGAVTAATRRRLAMKAFEHTARYDGAIANYLGRLGDNDAVEHFPHTFNMQFVRSQNLRYGENPHQSAAFYREAKPAGGSLARYRQVQGKELSYNNIADADAAWECVKSFGEPACVIVKHANPCGVAIGASLREAYDKAFKTDPVSAFGGILAFNRALDAEAAQALSKQFAEVVIAPRAEPDAMKVLAGKANLRVLEIPLAHEGQAHDYKRVGGGLLVQSSDSKSVAREDLRVVTKRQPTDAQWSDLLFAWRVAKFVKSNAIVFCGGGMTLGVGAGQTSRVDSARIAAAKAAGAKLDLAASVVASDAFFPFRDGLDVLVDAGAAAVIQPGGSMRDDEVIDAANERSIAMVFTGVRHFRH